MELTLTLTRPDVARYLDAVDQALHDLEALTKRIVAARVAGDEQDTQLFLESFLATSNEVSSGLEGVAARLTKADSRLLGLPTEARLTKAALVRGKRKGGSAVVTRGLRARGRLPR